MLIGRVDQPEPLVGRLRQRRSWFSDHLVHDRSVAATVSLHGNRYQLDPALVGHRVELA